MSVFVKPLIDLIPVWQCDRNWSKILCGTIPNPVHDLKVKVTDIEFLYEPRHDKLCLRESPTRSGTN